MAETNTFLTSLNCEQYNEENERFDDSFEQNLNSKYEYDDNNFSESEAMSSDESIDYTSEGEIHYKDDKIKNMISEYFYNAPKDNKNFMDLDQMVPARLIR